MSTASKPKEKETTMTYNKNLFIDSLVTEFNSSFKLLVSPFKAFKAMSLDPIKDAMKNSIEESNKFVKRHTPPDNKL